jgi:hypothetical protein
MALILLNPGETAGPFGQFSTDSVFGSTGNETAVIAANGKVTLDGSFNAGGDTVRILGNAGNYTASVVGSTLRLVSAGGADIKIPFGTAGATIQFEDATRTLQISGGNLVLGSQTIAVSGNTEVADGSGGGGGTPPPPPPPSSGDEIFLTAQVDRGNAYNGTSGDDLFIADLEQVDGLQVNTLGTGDRVGNQNTALGGNDELQAQITRGSTYGDGNAPIQPRVNGVQEIFLEALQSDLVQTSGGFYGGGTQIDSALVEVIGEGNMKLLSSGNTEVFFNAKDVRGHDDIWSWRSDANLNILDLTTIVTDGGHDDARNTGDITIGMGYTGSDNTRWEASDLKVFFDPDFLLSGKANKSELLYFILDEEADRTGAPPLNRINVDGLRFRVNGGPIIELSDPTADNQPNWAAFVAVLQDELAALKAAGTVPSDTTLFVDPSRTDFTFNDGGIQTQLIPAIVLKTETSAVFEAVGFSQVEDAIGNYDVYGRFEAASDETDIPVSVKIALEKAGEGALDVCDGGALVVGAMDKYHQGIPVFNVTVYGDESRPSILRYLDSTGGVLDTINIVSNNAGFPTNTWASLAIGSTNEGLTLINAAGFKGDLQLGVNTGGYKCDDEGCAPIYDLHTLIATGGGDVEFNGVIDSSGVYSYLTADGEDEINLWIDREALDYGGGTEGVADQLSIKTEGGDDTIHTYVYSENSNEVPNQVILNNVTIDSGTGDDTIWTQGEGNFKILAGDGNDTIYTDNSGSPGQWVFNVDMQGIVGGDTVPIDNAHNQNTSDLPGVPLQKSLIGGGTVVVTFSGAGSYVSNLADDDGGVMAYNGLVNEWGEAQSGFNGIESAVSIDVEGVNQFYGTQRDINNAIINAINNHPVLSKVLFAYYGDNNTLVVDTLIDGVFRTADLDITITRPTGNFSQAMINEGQTLGLITPASITTATPIAGPNASGNGYGMSLNNEFYSGVDNNYTGTATDNDGNGNTVLDEPEDHFNNLNRTGSTSSYETDNVITPGAGNDVVVLALADDGSINNNYWSLDGQLYDDAANEVLVFTGDFGKDTVFNFQVAGEGAYVSTAEGVGAPPLPRSGFDMLNVNAYLTGGIATTLSNLSGGNLPVDVAALKSLDPSEVMIIDFINDLLPTGSDGDPVQLFAGLNASHIANAINASASTANYGNLAQNGSEFDVSDLNATPASRSTLLMVQNDLNLGEYKFFQITWTDDANTAGQPVATVLERGIVDFGASLGASAPYLDNPFAIDEINFIGSVENTRFDGQGINQFGPDSYPIFFV